MANGIVSVNENKFKSLIGFEGIADKHYKSKLQEFMRSGIVVSFSEDKIDIDIDSFDEYTVKQENIKEISFELYCSEVEGIPYYNFLTSSELDKVYENYVEYCEKNGYLYE